MAQNSMEWLGYNLTKTGMSPVHAKARKYAKD